MVGNGDWSNAFASQGLDVDGDGRNDFVVASLDPSPDFAGRTTAYDTQSQEELFRYQAAAGQVSRGWVTDIDGDGVMDLVAASAGEWSGSGIRLIAGPLNGTVSDTEADWVIHGDQFDGAFPTSIAITDLNGDGIPDIAASEEDSRGIRTYFFEGQSL